MYLSEKLKLGLIPNYQHFITLLNNTDKYVVKEVRVHNVFIHI